MIFSRLSCLSYAAKARRDIAGTLERPLKFISLIDQIVSESYTPTQGILKVRIVRLWKFLLFMIRMNWFRCSGPEAAANA